jgi:hypothetical protein
MSASQRRKGAAGEREWCAELAREGITANRQLGQARDGGGDVIVERTLYEVKRRAGIAVRKWLDQAVAAAGVKLTPVVAMREDGRTDWMVVMRAEDYFALLRQGRPMGHSFHKRLEDLL